MVLSDTERIRFDLQIIGSTIEPGSKVLDLGCGNGDLLAWLETHKGVQCTGIEQDKEKAARCIARGLSVLQGDLSEEVEDYPTCSFDYVILSQTLQQVYDPDKLILFSAKSRQGRDAVWAAINSLTELKRTQE